MTEYELHEVMAKVRRMAQKYRHTPLGVDDAIGTGNLAIIEAAGSWDSDKGSLAGWCLIKAKWAMSTAAREFHGTKRQPDMEAPTDFTHVTEPSCTDYYHEVGTALHSVPERARRVLVMRACGLTGDETAAALGVSGSRISQLLSVGRRRLEERVPS